MMQTLRDIDWSFSSTAEGATALLLFAAIVAAFV